MKLKQFYSCSIFLQFLFQLSTLKSKEILGVKKVHLNKHRFGFALILSLLFSLAMFFYAGALNSQTEDSENPKEIPHKYLTLFNNMDQTMYIIIQSSQNSVDEWLQGYFKVTKNRLPAEPFPHKKLYRVYVNGTEGIPPSSSVKINLPFFSKLVPNPSPSAPDQYVNWWNGVRIYVYDNHEDFLKAYNEDKENVVTPSSAGPSCEEGSCPPMPLYSGHVGLTEQAHSQLAEYTFSNVVKGPKAYSIDYDFVDYDISYVDHAYLPIAIEPSGNPYIGYTGSVSTKAAFVKSLEDFIAPGSVG
jgi:hypothetical protein